MYYHVNRSKSVHRGTYMITCLHVLEDPNKSTLLIYSANPLTLYFVNILKGVTETIYIEMSTVSKHQSLMMV